jgi:ribosomal protein S8
MAAGKSSTKVAQIVHVGSHTLMAIAIGLGFALITARQEVFGIREAIEQSDDPQHG